MCNREISCSFTHIGATFVFHEDFGITKPVPMNVSVRVSDRTLAPCCYLIVKMCVCVCVCGVRTQKIKDCFCDSKTNQCPHIYIDLDALYETFFTSTAIYS